MERDNERRLIRELQDINRKLDRLSKILEEAFTSQIIINLPKDSNDGIRPRGQSPDS